MRISKAYEKAGVCRAMQYKIYGTCQRYHKPGNTDFENAVIDMLCDKVGGRDSEGLKKFLTDETQTHISIYMKYGIPKDKLFGMKKRFYVEWSKL